MDLSKGAFIVYGMAREDGGEREGKRGGGGGGGGERIFLVHYVSGVFFLKETL